MNTAPVKFGGAEDSLYATFKKFHSADSILSLVLVTRGLCYLFVALMMQSSQSYVDKVLRLPGILYNGLKLFLKEDFKSSYKLAYLPAIKLKGFLSNCVKLTYADSAHF